MTPNNQLDLFDNKNHTSPLQQNLEIEYIRDCFNNNESDALFDSLKKNIVWMQDVVLEDGLMLCNSLELKKWIVLT